MNENWSLHLTLLNNRTGQKIGANYPKNKYEILEMLDRCQIPYGSGDYAHLAVPFPDGTPDSLQLKLAGVIENEHCPPSIRQVNFLAEQLQRMSAESREALMQELTDMPMAVITDVIRIAGRLLSELPLPQTIDLSERAVLLTEQEPYFRLNVAALESESTEDGVWLDLPMQNGALEQLMLHLDVQDTDELEIRGLSGVVSPDDLELGEYEIFLADIHDYDAFARTLMECVPIHAMAKYKALLLARPTSIQGATKLATRLSCYEFFRYAELQDLLQEHKLHMDCRTLADHLNFDETNYGFIRYRLGHNLDVELDTIRLMENAKTEDAFWNATKYLFGRNSPDSFQRWIAFVDRQVESNQYADNFLPPFRPTLLLRLSFGWALCLRRFIRSQNSMAMRLPLRSGVVRIVIRPINFLPWRST